MVDPSDRTTFLMVGAGALASSLGPAMKEAGLDPVGVVSASPGRARALADRLGCTVTDFDHLPHADYVAICVPDAAITHVVDACSRPSRGWSGVAVFHTSGSTEVEVLDPLADRGATCFGFHPVQTFVYPGDALAVRGIRVGIGGDDRGLDEARRLAEVLGDEPLVVPDGRRGLYHLATALASNGLVTLAAVARQCLEACEISAEDASAALAPLIMAAAGNVTTDGPERALTGPVVRGDEATVMAHFRALSGLIPDLVPLYAALSAETARLAVRSGRLGPEEAADLLSGVALHLQRAQRAGNAGRGGTEP